MDIGQSTVLGAAPQEGEASDNVEPDNVAQDNVVPDIVEPEAAPEMTPTARFRELLLYGRKKVRK